MKTDYDFAMLRDCYSMFDVTVEGDRPERSDGQQTAVCLCHAACPGFEICHHGAIFL